MTKYSDVNLSPNHMIMIKQCSCVKSRVIVSPFISSSFFFSLCCCYFDVLYRMLSGWENPAFDL